MLSLFICNGSCHGLNYFIFFVFFHGLNFVNFCILSWFKLSRLIYGCSPTKAKIIFIIYYIIHVYPKPSIISTKSQILVYIASLVQ